MPPRNGHSDTGGPRPPGSSRTPGPFAELLRSLRESRARSRSSLAYAAGVDVSYVQRMEQGLRPAPGRYVVEALARELHVLPPDRDRLLALAGHAPLALQELGGWDAALAAVAAVLTDPAISPAERDTFRSLVLLLAYEWRRARTLPP